MKNNIMDFVGIGFYELIKGGLEDNMCYIGGHMLNKANAEQRIKEANTIRDLGYKVWNPIEDKSINSKDTVDVEMNNQLSKRIVRNDTTGILKSNVIVIEPETFAIGSICENGQIFGYKHAAKMIQEILDNNKDNQEKLIDDLNVLVQIMDKKILPHLDDIRITDIQETGYNRSWGVNQYLRGVNQALTGKEEGFYSFDNEIVPILKENNKKEWHSRYINLIVRSLEKSREKVNSNSDQFFRTPTFIHVDLSDIFKESIHNNVDEFYEELNMLNKFETYNELPFTNYIFFSKAMKEDLKLEVDFKTHIYER